jgi:hypothetical protein
MTTTQNQAPENYEMDTFAGQINAEHSITPWAAGTATAVVWFLSERTLQTYLRKHPTATAYDLNRKTGEWIAL